MRIISKYKDFYDYFAQDYDADLVYIRKPVQVKEYYDDLFSNNRIHTPYFSPYYGYKSSIRDNGELVFDNFIFGIYPFVYSQPILRIYYNYNGTRSNNNIVIVLKKEIVDKMLDANDDELKTIFDNEIYPRAQKEFDKKVSQGVCQYTKVHFFRYDVKRNNLKKLLRENTWKINCPNIFYKLEAPVLVKYYDELQYSDNYLSVGKDNYIHYVTNISFQKLEYNILKYWYDDLNNINTYNNIENFLWSIKQEPESNPDNNTKILSHGFDLKTSFRKSKGE